MRLGFLSDIDLANAMEYNVLGAYDFNRKDIRIAQKIFGPNAAAMKGKTTNSKNKMDLQEKLIIDVPEHILKEYRDVHVDIDIMDVNKIPFFTVISGNIKLIYCRAIALRNKKRIQDAMDEMIKEYAKRGFRVQTIHGDNKFTLMKNWLVDEHKMNSETYDTNLF